jgi:hypothetical protein
MRLSEAIALGRVTIDNPRASDLTGCAFGMALNAVGHGHFYENIYKQWPWVGMKRGNCPICNSKLSNWTVEKVGRIIMHVFDEHVMEDGYVET